MVETYNTSREGFLCLVQAGEERAHKTLDKDMRAFLVFSLERIYQSDRSDLFEKIIQRYITTFGNNQLQNKLLDLGDECLILVGLFADTTDKARNNIITELGQTSYDVYGSKSNESIFRKAAVHFTDLVLILRSVDKPIPPLRLV